MTTVSRKAKLPEAEVQALAKAILLTDAEIKRLENVIEGMRESNGRRGVELARRIGK